MDNINIYMSEYDDTLVRKLIKNVIIVSESNIEICFQKGTIVEEYLDFK